MGHPNNINPQQPTAPHFVFLSPHTGQQVTHIYFSVSLPIDIQMVTQSPRMEITLGADYSERVNRVFHRDYVGTLTNTLSHFALLSWGTRAFPTDIFPDSSPLLPH
jgi:hypothetical protein